MKAEQAHKNTRKARNFLGLLALVAVTGVLSAPVYAQSDRDTLNRVKRLENEVQTLSRALYKGEEPPPGAFSGGGDAAELGVRIDQLETQIRDMNGRLEEQGNQVNELRSQLERMSGDIDMRLNNVSGNAAPAPGPRYTATPSYETPPQPAPDNGLTSPEQAPYPQENPSNMGGYQWNSGNNAASEPSLGTLGSVSPNDGAAMAYENAFSLLKNGQYDAAEQGFNDFISQNPNHTLTANAKYWLGESYYARGQYDKASRTFAEAYQQYPKSSKAPDNLLKLGMSLAGLGKKEDACIALAQVEKEFSASAGPVLRRSQQEMKNFGC